MSEALQRGWEQLLNGPLLGIALTLLAFELGVWLNRRAGGTPALHPVLIAIGLLIGFLLLSGIPYERYFQGAQFIHFLLGPATVALAIPLFEHRQQIKQLFGPLTVACLAGIATAIASTLGLAYLFGAHRETVMSLAPKSVTTPIAMGISEQIGGIPSVAAALVLITGAIGCLCAPLMFRLLRIKNHAAQGFTLGLSAHGFGTVQAFTVSRQAGAFSGLAMGIAGVITAFLLPAVVRLFGL